MPDPVSELRHRLKSMSDDNAKLALYCEYLPAILTYKLSQAAGLVREALTLAKHLGCVMIQAELLRHLSAVHLLHHDYGAAITCAQKSYILYKKLYKDSPAVEQRGALVMACVAVGEVHTQIGNYDKARIWHRKACDLSDEQGSHAITSSESHENSHYTGSFARAAVLEALGRLSTLDGDLQEAQQRLQGALDIWEELGHLDGIGQALMALGKMYIQMGDYNSAHTSYQRSVEIFRKSKNPGLEVLALADLVDTLYRRGEIQGAIEQALITYDICVKLKEWRKGAEMMTAIGNFHESMGAIGLAMGSYTKAYNILPAWIDDAFRLPLLFATGRLHALRKETDAALLVLRWGLQIARDTGEKRVECKIHEALTEILEKEEQYQQALHHHKHYVALQKELSYEEQRRFIARIHAEYEVRRAARERDASLRRLNEFEKEMETKRRELIETHGTLAEQENSLGELQEIVTSLRDAQENNQSILAKKLINKLFEKIESCRGAKDRWKLFEYQFHSAYPDFKRKVIALVPSITPRELEICFLAKLNRHTATMASTLGLENEGIEGHIHNIRTKFALERKTNFWTFMGNI